MNNRSYCYFNKINFVNLHRYHYKPTCIDSDCFLQIPSLWLSINACINCWCVILMFKCHQTCYSRLCGRCRRIISIRCLYCYSCDCLCVIDGGSLEIDDIAVANLPNEEPQHILGVNSSSGSHFKYINSAR